MWGRNVPELQLVLNFIVGSRPNSQANLLPAHERDAEIVLS
jgi:hypothetical protein